MGTTKSHILTAKRRTVARKNIKDMEKMLKKVEESNC